MFIIVLLSIVWYTVHFVSIYEKKSSLDRVNNRNEQSRFSSTRLFAHFDFIYSNDERDERLPIQKYETWRTITWFTADLLMVRVW